MKHTIDKNYFPGWVRKSVSFTIDDGNLAMDRKFLAIVRPAGIIGTFNLCATDGMSTEEYREMYQGYEINNHIRFHPRIFIPDTDYVFSEEPFDPETADVKTLYRHPKDKNVWKINTYYYGSAERRWITITDVENYLRLIDETKVNFEAVFGAGSVRGFVWPCGQQVDYLGVHAHLRDRGYYGARISGAPIESFSLPEDRLAWKYCARQSDILTKMAEYEALPDDGELKFFSFGVHSKDYECDAKWDDLRTFCEKYGGRPNEFYYATVGQIFDYEDAIKALKITDTEIINDSKLTLYLKIDGEPITVAQKSTYEIPV